MREYLNDIIVRSDPASPNDLLPKGKRKKTQNRSFLGVKNVKKQKSEDAIDAFLDDNSESENESFNLNNKSSKSHLELKTQRVMANFAAQGLQYGRSTLKTHSSSMVRLQNTEQHFAIDHEMDLISM